MAHSLFIYGTLLDDQILASVLGHDGTDITSSEAEAPFMRVMKVADVDYPCLLEGQDDDVAIGALLQGLNDEDIAKLDQFEGENYQRKALEVICDKQLVKTQAYQPVIELETDGVWMFHHWSEKGREAFLNHDFDLDGVRKPKNLRS